MKAHDEAVSGMEQKWKAQYWHGSRDGEVGEWRDVAYAPLFDSAKDGEMWEVENQEYFIRTSTRYVPAKPAPEPLSGGASDGEMTELFIGAVEQITGKRPENITHFGPSAASSDPALKVQEQEDRMNDQVLDERDDYEERLSALADAVEEHFRVPVGEWSSANEKDRTALEILGGGFKTDSDMDRLAKKLAAALEEALQVGRVPLTKNIIEARAEAKKAGCA